ncbi:GNAT family N-acetyltransferase [Paractinoplanes lichenicola]|uniref:GNAT family N-acetyltransferase n=1 Tax=Paractinoplanes lichenicola TaxID=2802976 RepID=A0ABS1VPG2_9ACTN|nr:GNAT family protein [Actinoplanes lichenicola]MBL7256034.1 GNAT family N-acetyltransferase [Actinoplanes lichenicola]
MTSPAAQAVSIRVVSVEDAPTLAELYTEDREFLRRWDPDRPDEFFTPAGQRDSVAAALRETDAGRMWAAVILYEGGVVGRVSLNNILRGPLQSAFLGYWVSRRAAGRGVATAAVARCLDLAFGDLALHRIDAYAREENAGSCRVLEKNGFRRTGVSYGHVYVDGRWRDDIVFQRLAPWDDGVRRSAPARRQ